jgi:hypothetical protein
LGLREQINKKPGLASGITGGVVLVLVLIMFWQIRGGHRTPTTTTTRVYFTVDDGRTWFADDSSQVPPFDHEGAQAVRCFVFKCSSSAPFVGYLETLTQTAHDRLAPAALGTMGATPDDILVKKPGDKNWVLPNSPKGPKILDVHCPDGSVERPEPVYP